MLLRHRDGLNSLVALGFHCQALQDYVESATSLLPGQQKSSLIRRAVATGLSGVECTRHNCLTACAARAAVVSIVTLFLSHLRVMAHKNLSGALKAWQFQGTLWGGSCLQTRLTLYEKFQLSYSII